MLLDDFLNELGRDFAGDLRADPYSKVLYSTDASPYMQTPLAVALPQNADDVQALVALAARYGVPLLPRGGGSSLGGQTTGEAVVIDFSRYMSRVQEINLDEGWMRIEPGIVSDTLNRVINPRGYLYGADPASSNRATIGGMIGNNSTGAHSILYGMSSDHILEAEVVLGDGSRAVLGETVAGGDFARQLAAGTRALAETHAEAIKAVYPRTWRRATGYALNYMVPPHGYVATQPPGWAQARLAYDAPLHYPNSRGTNIGRLLAGSEGTLAVMTSVKLGLAHRPTHTGLLILSYDSIPAACDATPRILDVGPTAVELITRRLVHLTRSIPAYGRLLDWVDGDPAALLIVEFYGESDAHVLSQIERLEAHIGSTPSRRALTAEEQAKVWGVRKVGLGVLMSTRGAKKPMPFIEDVAVPVEHLGDYVRRVQRVFDDHGVDAAYYAHASAGCLHIRPLLDLKQAEDVGHFRSIAKAVFDVCVDMGGAMSGEHGDGLARTEWNEALFGPEIYGAFRQLKQLWDPKGILNPGKVVGDIPMDTRLRYGTEYRTIELKTHMHFDYPGGIIGAVEQCNGAGVCRSDGGVMCPSYHATREEEHSTRGRANALRAAMSGALPHAALTEQRMYEVLDLCLECKGCKAECPSAVDMAKIKYEFLAQYHDANGVPLRARVFADINKLSALASPVAPLVNLVARSPLGKLGQGMLGVARQRTLPAFEFAPFRGRFTGPRQRTPDATGLHNPVVLFVDTFVNYNEAAIGEAAVTLLQAAGFTPVMVTRQVCCGRTSISKGLLDQARDYAKKNIAALYPFAQAGWPIIGLEPSCLLTLRDEYVDLFKGDERAETVAAHAFMIEEFLSDDKLTGLTFAPRKVLFHGHCYQKALTGTAPLMRLLSRPGWTVAEIDSGCCGMAGSFGYEAEHYELSKTIANERLVPAVKAADKDTVIVAAGTSCRHQIADFGQREAVHPVLLLANALEA